jgi:hypothetical protein
MLSPFIFPHEFTPRNVADDLVMLSGSHRTSAFSHGRSVQEEDHERLCRFGHLCGYELDKLREVVLVAQCLVIGPRHQPDGCRSGFCYRL